MADIEIVEPKTKQTRKPKQPAAITVHVPAKKPWELTAEEVLLVKNHIAKGATDDELTFCLGVARRYKLDPFRGQIWFVKRRDAKLDTWNKGEDGKRKKVLGYRWIPIVGINGLLHIAARDHKKHFGSISRVAYGPMIDVEWTEWGDWVDGRPTVKGKHKIRVPEWAEVEAHKKGDTLPTVGQVFWEEIYPNVDSAPLVRQMPRLMLGKCATAQAVRRAYPATDGLYCQEEFMVEQYEPSPEAKANLVKCEAIDERIKGFVALAGGKLPNDAQLSLLEAGKSPEEVLLAASLPAKEPEQANLASIWPKREPGAEG